MSAPVRVLLVDDHAVMRAGFRMILEAQNDITVVGEAGTGAEAVDAASALQPDVICMDVQMPDMDGLEATRRIVSDPQVDAAVVIVTTFDRDDYLFQALRAGAGGFLLKNAGPEELVTAVRVAAAGEALLAPAVTRRVIERLRAGVVAMPLTATKRSLSWLRRSKARCMSVTPSPMRYAPKRRRTRMIRTVQNLRDELYDAPDDMPLCVMISPGMLVEVERVLWLDERCVLDLYNGKGNKHATAQRPRSGAQAGDVVN